MKKWNAVILAGDRGANDPVAKAAMVNGKAAARLQGRTLVERVIDALGQANCINKIIAVGPNNDCLDKCDDIRTSLERFNVTRIEPEQGPSASAYKGVVEAAYYPTLLVTCDLPLLTPGLIDDYCRAVENIEADFVVGAVEYSHISDILPELKKTKYRFSDQEVCFANVFSILTPSGLKAIDYWKDVESSRKNPIEVIRKIDWLSIIRYKLGCLSLEQASSKLSQKLDAHLEIENFVVPELAIDVDSAHDYKVLNEYLK